MCGLVGVAGTIETKHVNTFNDLLIVDMIRGKDSTGVAAIERSGNHVVFKCVGHAAELQDRRRYDWVVSTTAKALIGHNRKGTMGGVTSRNAHPFEFDDVIGAHNGTLTYSSKHALEGTRRDFGTDSEALYYHMDSEGIEATVAKLEGAWALSFYHKPNDAICFIRNKERPLYYVLTNEGKTLVWASEIAMLYLAMTRNGVEIPENGVKYLNEDVLLAFKLPERGKAFDEPHREAMKGRPPAPAPAPFVGGYQANQNGGQSSRPSGVQPPAAAAGTKPTVTVTPLPSTPAQAEAKATLDAAKGSITPRGRVHHLYKDEKGAVVNPEQFRERTTDGCAWCGNPVKFGDDVIFTGQFEVIGKCCVNNKDAVGFLQGRIKTPNVA